MGTKFLDLLPLDGGEDVPVWRAEGLGDEVRRLEPRERLVPCRWQAFAARFAMFADRRLGRYRRRLQPMQRRRQDHCHGEVRVGVGTRDAMLDARGGPCLY